MKITDEMVAQAAMAVCQSRKFESGQGTCAVLCMDQLGAAEMSDARETCPHCGHPFGYTIDGVFYPVASHTHVMPNGEKRVFKPEKEAK